MLYFAQILTEGEAHTIPITGDKSSGKTKNEPTEHNGRCAWGKKTKQAVKNPVRTLSGKEGEEKRKTALFHGGDVKKFSHKILFLL